jgi:beta-galactosidase/beta-glucuronidase
MWSWYRLTFDFAGAAGDGTVLHFGAIDWNATVYLNGKMIGTHSGGYDGFNFDLTGLKVTPTHPRTNLPHDATLLVMIAFTAPVIVI